MCVFFCFFVRLLVTREQRPRIKPLFNWFSHSRLQQSREVFERFGSPRPAAVRTDARSFRRRARQPGNRSEEATFIETRERAGCFPALSVLVPLFSQPRRLGPW